METAGQNTKQVMEENDALKQLMELLNQQNMNEQSQDFMGVFWYVAGMQVQLAAMVDELQGVREQLSQMQEKQPKSVTENLMEKNIPPSGESHKPVGTPDSGKKPSGGNSSAGSQHF